MDENLRRDSRISNKIDEQDDVSDNYKIIDNIIKLVNGVDSGYFFFDSYFSLPEDKSLASFQDFNQILEFVLKSFCRDDLPELSYKSLIIIYNLINDDNDEDTQQLIDSISCDELFQQAIDFFSCDEFIERSISLFSNPDKHFALLALKTQNIQLIKSITYFHSKLKPSEIHYLTKSLELGYLDHILDILDFPNAEEYDYFFKNTCLDAVVEGLIPICKMNLKECNSSIFQFSIDFIMSDNPKMNSAGIEILKCMFDFGFIFDIDEDLFQRFLYFADFGPKYVLTNLFALISSKDFPKEDNYEFLDLLVENEFYLKLIDRIEDDPSLSSIIFKFLDIMYSPEDDDPVIIKIFDILDSGNIKERIEAIKYLHTLTYDMPTEFCIFLAEHGILLFLSDFIDSQIGSNEIMLDLIRLASKIINSIVAVDADLMSFSGATEIYEALENTIGEFESDYDLIIERTIKHFPDQQNQYDSE